MAGTTGARRLQAAQALVALLIALGGITAAGSLARAAPAPAAPPKPMHWSADKTLWDRKTGQVFLRSRAIVRQPGETLTADEIDLDVNTRKLVARGNCVYVTPEATISAEEMRVDMAERRGLVLRGRVQNEKFTMAGEEIERLDARRFRMKWGEYSTCKDCPRSWTFQAERIQVEIEGYAHLQNVVVRISDAPALWFPYLIVPMKTERQSGLLFPKFGASSRNGLRFVQPFFWAINRSADMTVGLGEYSAQGMRAEWEGRYSLGPRSWGQANANYVHDANFPQGPANRWSVMMDQEQALPWGIQQKLKLIEVSDNLYPSVFGPTGDVPDGMMFLESSLMLFKATDHWNAYVEGRRFRNLVNLSSPSPSNLRLFDDSTVQLLPAAGFSTTDHPLLGSWLGERVLWNAKIGAKNFTRTTGAYDYDPSRSATPGEPFQPGVDILRKATRVSLAPALYAPLRIGDVLVLTPSAEYRSYYYSFHDEAPSLTRSYLLFQTSAQMQWEKIYAMDDKDAPRLKHLIRPEVTYSRIPFHSEDRTHPFMRQIERGKQLNRQGYYFDNEDFVPLDTSSQRQNYYMPLGHTVGFRLTNQLIRRHGSDSVPNPSYVKHIDLSLGQSINLLEYTKDDKSLARPLTRFDATLLTEFGQFATYTNYFYYPYYPAVRHKLYTQLSYVFERALHERVLSFDRSLTAYYAYNKLDPLAEDVQGGGQLNFSINDYVLPSARATYSFSKRQFITAGGGLLFQSPSQCWRFSTTIDYRIEQNRVEWGIDLSLNLTGEGFGGVSEIANRAR